MQEYKMRHMDVVSGFFQKEKTGETLPLFLGDLSQNSLVQQAA